MKFLWVTVIAIVLFATTSFADFDVTISNTYEYGVEIEGEESLLVTGGGADSIDAFDFSYIEIQNTAPYQAHVGGILGLYLHGSSNLHFFDGEIIGLDITSGATAILEGGQISSIESWQEVFVGDDVIKHIEIKSDDYDFNSSTNLLTGTWLDDSAFSIQLVNQDGYDDVIDNIFFTPEPTSLALLALGGLLLRRRSER